jgi:hypothetical protein
MTISPVVRDRGDRRASTLDDHAALCEEFSQAVADLIA